MKTRHSLPFTVLSGCLLLLATLPGQVACRSRPAPASPADDIAAFEKVADLPTGVWSMGCARFAGSPSTPVLGGMDGRIYKLVGDHLECIADIGAPLLRVLGADLDGDGQDEVLIAAADYPSHLYALSADGRILWKVQAAGCYVDMDIGRVGRKKVIAAIDFFGGIDLFSSTGERLRSIRKLFSGAESVAIEQPTAVALGDLDGDGTDEIVTSYYRGSVTASDAGGILRWRTASNDTAKGWERFGVAVPEPVRINGKEYEIELQRGGNFARNLRIADLDADGRPEILTGFFRSQLMMLSNEGRLLWNKILNYDVVDHMINYVHMDQRGVYKDSVAKSHPIFEIGAGPDGRSRIIALQPREDILETSTHFGASDIFVLDHTGKVLRRDIRDATWFRVAVDVENPSKVWLVNRVTGSAVYRTSVGRLEAGLPPQSINDVVEPVRNWTRLGGQLAKQAELEKTEGAAGHKISIGVLYDHASFDIYFYGFETLKHNLLAMNRFFNGRGNRRVEYVFRVNLQEIPHGRTDTRLGLVTQEQAFELADFLEEHHIPVVCWLSHGVNVTLRPETMIGISQRAPTAFRGVVQVESGGLWTAEYQEFLKVIETIAPQLERAGQKIFMHTTGSFWSQGPAADPNGLGRLIRKHGKLLVPFVKTNNSQTAEQEIGAALALWKAGYVDEWGYTSIDHWTFTNIFRMNAFKMASHMGTVDIAALALGARHILYYPPILRAHRDQEGRIRKLSELEPQLTHMRAIEQLIENRVIEPVGRDQVRSLSPILFSLGRLKDRDYGAPKAGILRKTIHFQQTAPNHASTIFYGPGIGSSKMVPADPYGIYGMLPDYLDAARVSTVKEVIPTNLVSFTGEGGPIGMDASARNLLAAIGRNPMLFRADGAFLGIQSFAKSLYRLVVIDPGHIEQAGVTTIVQYQGSGAIRRVTDRVTGSRVAHEARSFGVHVEPGLFRIFDVWVHEE